MRQRIFITVILLTVLSIVSCNFNKKEDCAKLDKQIAQINDSLLLHGKDWGDELKIAVNTLDFSGLQPVRVGMEEYIGRSMNRVRNIKNVGGSEMLIEKEIAFLEVEKEIVSNRLVLFEQFTDSVTMDELSDAYVIMQVGAEKEQELLKELFRLREEYAEKNDFPKFINKY